MPTPKTKLTGRYYRLTKDQIKKVTKLGKQFKCSDAEVIRRLIDSN